MTNESALRNSAPLNKPEVTTQVENLQIIAKMLHEAVASLEQRLAPVLAERKVEAGKDGGSAPEPVRVPLAEELHRIHGDFKGVRDQVDSIKARLEV